MCSSGKYYACPHCKNTDLLLTAKVNALQSQTKGMVAHGLMELDMDKMAWCGVCGYVAQIELHQTDRWCLMQTAYENLAGITLDNAKRSMFAPPVSTKKALVTLKYTGLVGEVNGDALYCDLSYRNGMTGKQHVVKQFVSLIEPEYRMVPALALLTFCHGEQAGRVAVSNQP